MDNERINAEVISVFPNKVKISVDDLNDFQLAEERLKVGSYLRIADNDNSVLLAIIENFSIEIVNGPNSEPVRKYILEANPLGMIKNGIFERGGDSLAIPPQKVEPAKNEDIQKIYLDSIDPNIQFTFSKLSSTPNISVPVDGNKFFNKHIAIVGSTGSGKSHSVATIIQKAINVKAGTYQGLNNSHIVIFDVHSEYHSAFPNSNYIDIANLSLPCWLLNSEELEELFIDSEANDYKQRNVFKEAIVENKKLHYSGTNPELVGYDTPTYFNINEILTYIKNRNNEKKDKQNNIVFKLSDDSTHIFDENTKKYLFTEMVSYADGSASGTNNGSFINFINRLENKLHDQRLSFLFSADYTENTTNNVLAQFLGYGDNHTNVTIVDLSGVPFEVLSITVSLISRILFEYGYYYKRLRYKKNPEETLNNDIPLLLVYEEAHKYVPSSDLTKYRASKQSIERIAKEGRKYGITLLLASQRPAEISETIFSQCSNFLALRLTNPNDQNYVKRLLPDTLGNLVDKMPAFKAGECLLVGDAVILPSIVQIDECDLQPSSNDIPYLELWKEQWKDLDIPAIKQEWHMG